MSKSRSSEEKKEKKEKEVKDPEAKTKDPLVRVFIAVPYFHERPGIEESIDPHSGVLSKVDFEKVCEKHMSCFVYKSLEKLNDFTIGGPWSLTMTGDPYIENNTVGFLECMLPESHLKPLPLDSGYQSKMYVGSGFTDYFSPRADAKLRGDLSPEHIMRLIEVRGFGTMREKIAKLTKPIENPIFKPLPIEFDAATNAGMILGKTGQPVEPGIPFMISRFLGGQEKEDKKIARKRIKFMNSRFSNAQVLESKQRDNLNSVKQLFDEALCKEYDIEVKSKIAKGLEEKAGSKTTADLYREFENEFHMISRIPSENPTRLLIGFLSTLSARDRRMEKVVASVLTQLKWDQIKIEEKDVQQLAQDFKNDETLQQGRRLNHALDAFKMSLNELGEPELSTKMDQLVMEAITQSPNSWPMVVMGALNPASEMSVCTTLTDKEKKAFIKAFNETKDLKTDVTNERQSNKLYAEFCARKMVNTFREHLAEYKPQSEAVLEHIKELSHQLQHKHPDSWAEMLVVALQPKQLLPLLKGKKELAKVYMEAYREAARPFRANMEKCEAIYAEGKRQEEKKKSDMALAEKAKDGVDNKHSVDPYPLSAMGFMSLSGGPSSSLGSLTVSSRFSGRDEKTKKEEIAFMDKVECETISNKLKNILDTKMLTLNASKNEIKLLSQFLDKGVTPRNLAELDLHMKKAKKVIAATEPSANIYETLCNLESLEKKDEESYHNALFNLVNVLNKHESALTLDDSKQRILLLREALHDSRKSPGDRKNVLLRLKHATEAVAAEPGANFYEQFSNLHLNIHDIVGVQLERKHKLDREMLEGAREDHLTELDRKGRKKFDSK